MFDQRRNRSIVFNSARDSVDWGLVRGQSSRFLNTFQHVIPITACAGECVSVTSTATRRPLHTDGHWYRYRNIKCTTKCAGAYSKE